MGPPKMTLQSHFAVRGRLPVEDLEAERRDLPGASRERNAKLLSDPTKRTHMESNI